MGDRDIQEAIRQLAGTHLNDNLHLVAATVISVDQQTRTCTCTPIGGTAVTDLNNVMLMPEVDDGLLPIPAIDSTVLVMWSTKNVPYITMFSRLQKMLIVTLDGIQLQGGELGGLVVAGWLVEQLNIIQDTVNELNAKLDVLSPTPVIPVIVDTTVEDIANSTITQGA